MRVVGKISILVWGLIELFCDHKVTHLDRFLQVVVLIQ
jgi:hypothetical protein